MEAIFVVVFIIIGFYLLGKLFAPMAKHLIIGLVIGLIAGGILYYFFGLPMETSGLVGIIIAVFNAIFGKIKTE